MAYIAREMQYNEPQGIKELLQTFQCKVILSSSSLDWMYCLHTINSIISLIFNILTFLNFIFIQGISGLDYNPVLIRHQQTLESRWFYFELGSSGLNHNSMLIRHPHFHCAWEVCTCCLQYFCVCPPQQNEQTSSHLKFHKNMADTLP